MNRPILSICIPTYNRAHYLAECLESIKKQLAGNTVLGGDIEIVVSDNHSTDNTMEVVKKYEDSFANFRYFVNKSNLGGDLNIFNAVKESTGKYCWHVGDDDLIVNGAIGFIYNCLKNNKYDVVCVEAEPKITNKDYGVLEKFSEDSLVKISDFNKFYFDGYCKGIISTLAFNREIWMKTVDTHNFLKYCLYYETILKMLVSTQKEMLYIKKPMVITGQDCRWIEDGTELVTFINFNILSEKMIVWGFDKERILDGLIKNNKRIIIILLMAKGHGLKCSIENLKYIYRNSKRVSFLRLFLATIIYFIPNRLIVMIRDFKKALINNH